MHNPIHHHYATATNGMLPERPGDFHSRYLATQPVPYSFVETPGRSSSSGGVLSKGQCVWLGQPIRRDHLPNSVEGFAESIGLIMVDPRRLKKSDGSF